VEGFPVAGVEVEVGERAAREAGGGRDRRVLGRCGCGDGGHQEAREGVRRRHHGAFG
jgi:hypothetical protein